MTYYLPRRSALLTVALLGIGAATPLFADAARPEDPLEQVLVTGTRLSDVAAQLPASTTVIDQQSIALRDPATLPDLLRTLPGVQFSQPGGGAGIATLHMRGCQPNYTLFLVDGVKVTDSNDSRGGSFDLSTVSPREIERIEVIRGPQSAVYGADAMCGVINVVTRSRSDEWGTTARVSAGLRSAYQSSVELSGPLMKNGGVSLRASTGDQGAVVPGATFGSSTVNGKVTFDNGAGWRVVAHGRQSLDHGSSYPDLSGGPEFALQSARDARSSRETSFDTQGTLELTDGATLNAVASKYQHHVVFASPAIAGPFGGVIARTENADLNRDYGLLDVVLALPASFRATAGLDYMRENADLVGKLTLFPGFSLPDGYQQTRHNTAAFGELQYAGVEGLTVLGSVRRDKPSVQAAQNTARAGFVYTPDRNRTEIRAYWGQGFKLPSLFSLGNALVGNPNLLAERSRTTEVGASRWFIEQRLRVGVAMFDNVFTNLVDFDGAAFAFFNRREMKTRGGELELQYEFTDQWHMKGEATYVSIDPEDSTVPIHHRPKWRGSLQSWWTPNSQCSLYATWMSVGKVADSSVATGDVLVGGYNRLDVNGEWRPTNRVAVSLAVDNLLDRRYGEAVGFTAPGIQPRLSVSYRF